MSGCHPAREAEPRRTGAPGTAGSSSFAERTSSPSPIARGDRGRRLRDAPALPRVVGNQAFGSLLRGGGPPDAFRPAVPDEDRARLGQLADPARFVLVAPDDPDEQNARLTAARVAGHGPLQGVVPLPSRGPARGSGPVSPALARQIAALRSGGSPLPGAQRSFFEGALGSALPAVRVHDEPAGSAVARALDARAFSFEDHIVLGPQAPPPGTAAGMRLLAHELAHVLQATRDGGISRIRRDHHDDGVTTATQPAPVEEEQPVRGLDVDRARALNLAWWDVLALAEVAPLGPLRPDTAPVAYANRTWAVQQLGRTGVYRRFAPGARLLLDGILGPQTFLFLYAVARAEDLPEGDREPLTRLGVDLSAVAGASGSAASAMAVRDRPDVAGRWTFRTPVDRVLRYYRRQYQMNRRDADLLDQVLFGGPAPQGITREDRHELLSRLYAGTSLQGVAALATVDRSSSHPFDVAFVVARPSPPVGSWAVFFAFRISTGAAAADATGALGLRLPAGRRASRVRTELEARTSSSGQRPTPVLLIAYDLPAPDSATRAAVVDPYVTEQAIVREQRREEIEQHNRQAAAQRADRFRELAADRRDLRFVLRVQDLLSDFRGTDPSFFEYFLDHLSAGSGDGFSTLFDAVEDARYFVLHALLLRLTLATRYASHERVTRSLEVLNSRRRGALEHTYLADEVRLGGPDGPALRVGEVAGDRSGAYLRDEVVDRIKPERMSALMEVAKDEAKEIWGRILRGEETRELSDEEIATAALERAVANLPLRDDDIERDVTYEESVRLLAVEQREEDGVQRTYLRWQVVERYGEEGPWAPVLGGERSGDDAAFDFQLFLYRLSQTVDVLETAAIVVTFAAAAAVAWEAGLVGWLLSLGGGAVPVGISVGISTIIYVLTSQTLTLEGFLFAALDGYLGAVAFRSFSPLGKGIAGRIGTATARQRVAGWLLARGAVGGLSGASTLPAGRFARDLVAIAAGDRTGLSSLDEYLRDMTLGFALGVLFEVAGGALQSTFLAAGRTTLENLADVVRVLRADGITPGQWTAQATGALSRVARWAAENLHDDLARKVYAAFRERIAAVTDAFVGRVRTTLLRQVLDLAEITISRDGALGLERLLRVTAGRIPDDDVAAILQRLRAHPERLEPLLRLLKDVQTTVLDAVVDSRQLAALAESPHLLQLSTVTSPAEVGATLRDLFRGQVAQVDDFSRRLLALHPDAQAEALQALRARLAGPPAAGAPGAASDAPEAVLVSLRLDADLSQLELAPGSTRVLRPRGVGGHGREEIAFAEQLAAERGSDIVLPRSSSQAAVDGFYRSTGTPVQLKSLTSSSPAKVVTRANEAYEVARKFSWRGVELEVRAPNIPADEVLRRWNAPATATPSVKPMPGGHIHRIRVHCADAVLDLPVPTAAPTAPVPTP